MTSYYSAWDNDRATLSQLYRPHSKIVWNGNPISGSHEMVQFVDKMPASKHDVGRGAALWRLSACACKSNITTTRADMYLHRIYLPADPGIRLSSTTR